VMQPLGADLASVVQPIRNSTCQAANSCSGQSGERGDDGRVQRLHFYYGDAGGRGPSEISRELRCPDR
jgi:hypothetical protein